MLGLNGLAKKKMDIAMGEEQTFKKEGWELVLKTGMKVEDSECEEYLALVKAYYQHPVVRIHVHIRKKDLTYEIEQQSPDDLRGASVVRVGVVHLLVSGLWLEPSLVGVYSLGIRRENGSPIYSFCLFISCISPS